MLPKLNAFYDLLKVLDCLYCHFRLEAEGEFIFQNLETHLGKGYRVSINPNVAYIALDSTASAYTGEGYYDDSSVYMNSSNRTFGTELWDDKVAVFPLRFQRGLLNNGIRKAAFGRLDMQAIMYPYLDANFSFEDDIFEPWLFQNMTIRTLNEISTQILALKLNKKLTAFQRDYKQFFPTIRVNYDSFDELEIEEIQEIRDLLYEVLQERSTHYEGVYRNILS